MLGTIRSAALSPALSGLLLFALTLGPPSLRAALARRFPSDAALARTITGLKALFALGLVGEVNARLSQWALDSWQGRKKGEWSNWSGEVAVVTGGSNGIGALVVKRLSKKGIKVVVVDVQELPEQLQGYANISFQQCDITDPEAVKETADAIRSSVGAPSILLNNAGIALGHTILDTTPEYLRKLFDVNLLSHFYLIQAFLPDMIAKRKGHILSTASMASFVAVPQLVDYCCTKAGVMAFNEGLRSELRRVHNAPEIKISTVHPIYVRTRLIGSYEAGLRKNGATIIEPEDVADAMAKQIFSGRSGQIVLPAHLSLASALRGLPHWVQELVRGAPFVQP